MTGCILDPNWHLTSSTTPWTSKMHSRCSSEIHQMMRSTECQTEHKSPSLRCKLNRYFQAKPKRSSDIPMKILKVNSLKNYQSKRKRQFSGQLPNLQIFVQHSGSSPKIVSSSLPQNVYGSYQSPAISSMKTIHRYPGKELFIKHTSPIHPVLQKNTFSFH
ncbi:unnamed protein product [Brugia pahangi]|uniref:Ovule protein n=1 Tax=Brugia pahangi TaxID=6280 RepID=A0A0N4TZT3_BRUPA|nr:unnamed protein product [Brugia pahangi]